MVAVGQNENFGQPWNSLFIPKNVWADFTIHPTRIVTLLGFIPKLCGNVLKAKSKRFWRSTHPQWLNNKDMAIGTHAQDQN